jgi:hypothetical protein
VASAAATAGIGLACSIPDLDVTPAGDASNGPDTTLPSDDAPAEDSATAHDGRARDASLADSGVGDGGEGGGDGEPGPTFCESLDAQPTFCADFDTPGDAGVASGWDQLLLGPGASLLLDGVNFQSPPYALQSSVNPDGFAYLRKTLPGASSQITVDFRVYYVSYSAIPDDAGFVASGPALALYQAGVYLAVWDNLIQCPCTGSGQFPPLEAGVWHSIHLEIDLQPEAGTSTLSASVDQVPVFIDEPMMTMMATPAWTSEPFDLRGAGSSSTQTPRRSSTTSWSTCAEVIGTEWVGPVAYPVSRAPRGRTPVTLAPGAHRRRRPHTHRASSVIASSVRSLRISVTYTRCAHRLITFSTCARMPMPWYRYRRSG